MSARSEASAQPILSQQVATGAGAAALPAAPAGTHADAVLIQNDPASTANVLIGTQADQHLAIAPGSTLTLAMRQPDLLFVKAAAGTPNINVLYFGE